MAGCQTNPQTTGRSTVQARPDQHRRALHHGFDILIIIFMELLDLRVLQ